MLNLRPSLAAHLSGAVADTGGGGGDLPAPPEGSHYIINADGAYLLNADGAYILANGG